MTKPKAPRGDGALTMSGNKLENMTQGDNNKYLELGMAVMLMPPIDLTDDNAVTNRLKEFFQLYAEHDSKPTISGLAAALGVGRLDLYYAVHDTTNNRGYKLPLSSYSLGTVKKAYNMMEQMWEHYMLNGKINPVTGIFLAKNNYDYVDKVETVITPNVKSENDFDANDLSKRYMLEDGQDKQE